MRIPSYIYVNRLGIYYLRTQRNGVDRRISLRTRDPKLARAYAYNFGVMISNMETNNIKRVDFGLVIHPDGTIEAKDINTKDDAENFQQVVEKLNLLKERNDLIKSQTVSQASKTVYLADAMESYKVVFSIQNQAEKTRKMAFKVFDTLVASLPNLDMSDFNDSTLEREWFIPRSQEVAITTLKKELSWIYNFSVWCSAPTRNYMNTPISLKVKVPKNRSEHWDFFSKHDINLLLKNLPEVSKAWHFWLVLLGMYTGARIAELSKLKVGDFDVKNGIDVLLIDGTKTIASKRLIPLHADLIKIGLLEYVAHRKDQNAEMLFPITESKQNGWGAAATKFFGAYRQKIGLVGEKKVFHSFRDTIVDHLKQLNVPFEKRCQYVGHSSGGGVHNKIYGRNVYALGDMKKTVVDVIDWSKYFDNFSIDFELLKKKADSFIK